GVMWGSVPQFYSDGTRIDLDRSANSAPDWTNWPVTDEQAFVELAASLGNGWRARGVLTYKNFEESETIVVLSSEDGTPFPDPITGLGMEAYAGDYYSNYERLLADFVVSGPVELFGRRHQFAAGVSWARSDGIQIERDFGWFDYPAYSNSFRDLDIPIPAFLPPVQQVDLQDTLLRGFASSQINVSDNLNLVIGVSAMNSETEGVSYGEDQAREGGAVSPYLGVVYDINENISLYGSYTDIYSPQEEVDAARQKLDPIQGDSVEIGFKSEWFNELLYVTGTWFQTRQSGIAEYAGYNDDPFYYYYAGVENTAEGVELEFAGRITDDWRVSGGYTHLFYIEDNSGNETRQYQPRTTIKIGTSYTIPQLRDLTFGAQVRWQSDIFNDVDALPGVRLEQESYATIDLSAGIDLTENVRLQGVLRNATDELYFYSLSYGNDGHAFYAPGRNFLVSLRYGF
ncbi:MAG TPA: TonB-dependent receptor, partial [Verrucomicrobiae bacterium]|nr:TonB-dependent receptor [Verrucomicrobiae bacterium]